MPSVTDDDSAQVAAENTAEWQDHGDHSHMATHKQHQHSDQQNDDVTHEHTRTCVHDTPVLETDETA